MLKIRNIHRSSKIPAKIIFIYFGLSILPCIPDPITLENCNFKVNVDLDLRNNGFHRNLSYVLTFVNEYDETLPGDTVEHCHLGLEQTLPAGLYFRPDNVGSHLSVIKSPVNIEDSTEDSKEVTIQLFAPIHDWTVNLHLLVHARYHAANAVGGKVRNVIGPPKVYMNCRDDRLFCVQYTDQTVTNNFCQKGAVCTWKNVPTVVEPSKLVWDVPVGNTSDYYTVAAGTALAVAAGSLYLLTTVHDYMLNRRFNTKIK